MIAIATGKKDLDESLKEHLEDSEIVESMESLYENLLKYDTVVISKHLKATAMIFSELLFFLKQSSRRIIYIASEDEADEIKMCIKFDIRDIMFEPVDVYKVIYMVEEKAGSNNPKSDTHDVEDSLFSFYEDMYKNEESELKEIEEVEVEKDDTSENSKCEVEKGITVTDTVAIPVVQAVKKENIFVFTLNYVYKLLSLFINLIATFVESLQWIVISVILTAAAYYIFKNGGIDSFDGLVKMIKAYFKLG
jgi:hypothetical protein